MESERNDPNALVEDAIKWGEGKNKRWSDGIQRQELWFDFFNYAGIHRHVFLYTTPTIYIKDIHIHTGLNGDQGVVNYIVIVNGATKEDKLEPYIALYDSDGHLVDEKFSLQGTFIINDPHLWWPLFMHPQPGYLYSLQVSLCNPNSLASSDGDIYRLPVGIRHLQWNDTSLTINGKPLYLRGFGKHEDFHVKGKGEDLSVLIKDFNLLKWVGANSFRTSHYPYSEETMYMADRHGILIIDETPAVSLRHFKKEVLDLHTQILQELISRDKNHPSVIMWSLGNECQTVENSSRPYFQHLSELARTLDKTRPITLVLNAAVDKDHVGDLLDVVSVNRYFGWYEDPGQTEVIGQKVQNEYHAWHAKYHKPVLVTEYGAGAVAGLHNSPGFVFTEDYQVELLLEHFKAYAGLRQEEGSFLIGEMIWNFADFMTDQDSKRVYGNRKGIFTRDRQPKAGAHIVRCHYFALAKELDSFNSTHLCYPSFYGG
ncbi:unnamed protein product [Darwinula stevensoni]|uniref:Beta-glucuronidase n=1 Tax=Darwinula stevensoni TaxID=69355 RepID=A0A7R8X8A5_9CRUS|nr:unnamed protein product [Darwinula stevensoni]CAG0887871.1 unnamed protein product [Darwinula stevensoni]